MIYELFLLVHDLANQIPWDVLMQTYFHEALTALVILELQGDISKSNRYTSQSVKSMRFCWTLLL